MNIRTYWILLTVVVVVNGLYVPNSLHCGTPADVQPVPAFPFSISRPVNEYADIVSTWEKPLPELITTYVVADKYAACTYVQSNLALYEANFTGTVLEKIATYNLSQLTWDSSFTKIDSCEGFYMMVTLDNGAQLEYTWYIYKEDYNFTYAGKQYIALKGDLNNYFFLSNYTYTYPNISRPAFEMYMRYPRPLTVTRADWATILGEGNVFPQDTAAENVTKFGITNTSQLVPTPGYELSAFNLYSRYMNYALLDDEKMNVHFRAVGYEIENNGIVSFTLFATYLGDFTSSDNSMYYLQRVEFEANITKTAGSEDGDSSSVSVFSFSIWSAFVRLLFVLFQ
jgi:hypothetical protein